MGTVGSTEISGLSGITNYSDLRVGELVGGSGTNIQIPPGAEIASISSGASTIYLTLPLTGTAVGSTTLSPITITGDNNGTLIVDSFSGTGGPQCWQKIDYRGDPHEWGAIGDGNNDDTTPIQDWFGAYGNVNSALAPLTAPANFGPWIATIPANYKVKSPLVCPPNANIMGQANLSAGATASGVTGSPPVRIFAGSGFQGGPALLQMSAYCRLSGITIDAFNSGGITPLPTGTMNPGSTMITNVSSVAGVQPGMRIEEPNGQIPAGTTVVSSSSGTCPCTITLNTPMTGSSSPTESLGIGIDAVDVLGTHAAIDGHSLAENGFYNVNCGLQKVDGLQIKDAEIIKSFDDGLHLTNCSNVRLLGDLISQNGSGGVDQAGVYFSGDEISIEGGVIEESGGPGLFFDSGAQASVTGMYFDNNGDTLSQPAIRIANSKYISICA